MPHFAEERFICTCLSIDLSISRAAKSGRKAAPVSRYSFRAICNFAHSQVRDCGQMRDSGTTCAPEVSRAVREKYAAASPARIGAL